MKLIKLHLEYIGRYGGEISETVLFPKEADLVVFSLDPGVYGGEVLLNEIEGKHSVSYADLTIEFLDLKEMSNSEVNSLVNEAGTVCHLESYLEMQEIDYYEYMEDETDKFRDKYEKNLENLKVKWDLLEHNGPLSFPLAEKILKKLKAKYAIKEIVVSESDYSKVLELLEQNEVEVLQ